MKTRVARVTHVRTVTERKKGDERTAAGKTGEREERKREERAVLLNIDAREPWLDRERDPRERLFARGGERAKKTACYQRIGRQPKRLRMKFCVHYKCAQPCRRGSERERRSSGAEQNERDRETGER